MADSELQTAVSSADEIRALIAGVPHWHHIMRFPHDISSPGVYDPAGLLGLLALPSLAGKRVLDVGTRDGFFAFACERLGAEVLAVDHSAPELTGFPAAKAIYGSRVEYLQANVYDLTPAQVGTFDYVLFLGVLYHLRHPLLALDRLRPLCRDTLWLESLVCDAGFFTGFEQRGASGQLSAELRQLPVAQFLPVGRFHSDATNKWMPNACCLEALLEDAMFQTESSVQYEDRALIRARAGDSSTARRWIVLDSGLRTRGS